MKLICFLAIFFGSFIFGQTISAKFPNGEYALKKLIYSKIKSDSIDIDEDTVVKLIFKINKIGKVTDIKCETEYSKTKSEFLRIAKQIKENWIPATKNGKKIESFVEIKFPFRFE